MKTLKSLNCHVKAVLGERRLPLSELETLGEGSILELDTLAGEPVDIEVNGTPLYKGEVLTVDNRFAVRITGAL